MGNRAVTWSSFALALLVGMPAVGEAQGDVRLPTPIEHRVSVMVPVIISLVPPDPASNDRSWRIRSNDPRVRRHLASVRRVGDSLRITLVPP